MSSRGSREVYEKSPQRWTVPVWGPYVLVLLVYSCVVPTVPRVSPTRRPTVAALGCSLAPDVETPRAACPWAETITVGMKRNRGLEAAPSKSVPVCTIDGVWPVGMPLSSYQRTAVRVGEVATPELSTPMLCAVQRLPFRMVAANSRSSSASSVFVLPVWGAANGKAVDGTVMRMLEEMLGVPPWVATRRSTNSPKNALLTPMKDPSVALGSTLSTPCGVNGPSPVPKAMFRKTVTTIGPPPSTELLRTTYPSVPLKAPVPANTFGPMYSAFASIPNVS